MTQTIYAVERRTGDYWRVIGDNVFTTREAAEHFEEEYVENDLSSMTTTVDIRVHEYTLKD